MSRSPTSNQSATKTEFSPFNPLERRRSFVRAPKLSADLNNANGVLNSTLPVVFGSRVNQTNGDDGKTTTTVADDPRNDDLLFTCPEDGRRRRKKDDDGRTATPRATTLSRKLRTNGDDEEKDDEWRRRLGTPVRACVRATVRAKSIRLHARRYENSFSQTHCPNCRW